MAVPAPLFGWLATYASASFQARGEDKDLASVVWETALAAFQAVAAEPPRASPAEFVEGLNRTLKIGTGMAPVSKKFLDRNVWCGRALQETFVDLSACGLASMYPASDWSVLCSGPSWTSARIRSH